MKITVNETSNTTKYPFVGVCYDGAIVLFTQEETGVCLRPANDSTQYVGKYQTCWLETNFTLMRGTIIIECP